jgi:5-formyltetrahydrofolate cyclo-ligase
MKDRLRAEMRARLKSLSGIVYLPVGIEPPIIPSTVKTLFAYLAFGGEIDPARLIDDALSRGVTVAVPRAIKTGDARDLEFRLIESASGPFARGAYGIPEPRTEATLLWPAPLPDSAFPLAVLVPALAFDAHGNRLGRGAGYYDRFLEALLSRHEKERRAGLINLIGACHSFQIAPSVPVEAHDIRVDCIACEKGCIVK